MLKDFPRKLTVLNIDNVIEDYLKLLKTSPLNIEAKNVLSFLNKN